MAGDKKITRNRISYSCQKCRQRKVKCDKVHPVCGACQKTGEECIYVSGEANNQDNNDQAPLDVGRGKKRKQSLTGTPPEDARYQESSGTVVDLEDQLLQLSVLLSQVNSVATRTMTAQFRPSQTVSHDSNMPIAGAHSSNDDGIAQTGFNQNRVGNGKYPTGSRVEVEQSPTPTLTSISAQLDQLTNLLQSYKQGLKDSDSIETVDRVEINISNAPSQRTKVENLLFVPTEGQRNVLFRSWLSSVYPLLPIVHPALVLIRYRTFHFWYTHGYEKSIPNPCEDHIPLIFAIYYAGMASLSHRGVRRWFDGVKRQHILSKMYKQFKKTLDVPSELLLNPITLAARIMMCYMSPRDNHETGLAGTIVPLIRAAYSSSLHRERPNDSLDQSLAEVRRRLWWEIVNLDTLEATGSSLPPFIDHRYCDTLMLGEIKDSKLDTPEAQKYKSSLKDGVLPDNADDPATINRSSMVSAIYIVMKARTILASITRKLLNINLAAKPKTKEDLIQMRQALEDIDQQISASILRIPAKGLPEYGFTPAPSKPGQSVALDHGSLYGEDLISTEIEVICGAAVHPEPWEMSYLQQHRYSIAAFHKWVRILLSMSVDQCRCFSFAPFLSNSKRKLWLSARQCSLKHAHSCLRKFNTLAIDIELEKFRWTWPNMFQPIHACIILLLDAYERPTSAEAPRSRTLFDQMLLLSSPEYGIVGGEDGVTSVRPLQESGNEAYVMLMHLRTKAWQKAGLDPNFLWTDQDQIDVGIAAVPTDTDKIKQSFREDLIFRRKSSAEHDHPSVPSLRTILQPQIAERAHPSELALPEDLEPPKRYTEYDTPTSPSTPSEQKTTRRLLRARPDQPRAPAISSTHPDVSQKPPGRIYNFRPPSDLYDVNELIRRIRSAQRSNRETQSEKSPSSSHETAAMTKDLADFFATTFPIADAARRFNENGAPGVSPGHNAGQIPIRVHTPNSTVPSTGFRSGDTRQPTHGSNPLIAASTGLSTLPGSSTTISTAREPQSEPHQDPTIDPTIPVDATTTTTVDMDMDFDWTKWDDMFGHIVDDDFRDMADDTHFARDEAGADTDTHTHTHTHNTTTTATGTALGENGGGGDGSGVGGHASDDGIRSEFWSAFWRSM